MEASWTALWTILGEARECKERKHFECITHVGYACTNWRRYHAAQRGAWAVMLFAKVSSAISSGSSVSRAATTRIIEALSIVVPGYQGEGWSRASLSLSFHTCRAAQTRGPQLVGVASLVSLALGGYFSLIGT